MTDTATAPRVTAEQLLAMPEDDGVERELIRGRLVERPMTRHNRTHAGVKLVWLIDPDLRTVTVYRPDGPAEIFSPGQTLTAEPHLPGFSVAVDKLFA